MNLYPMIADKLEREPALIDQALKTLAHWVSIRAAPSARLDAWRRILTRARSEKKGMAALLRLLRDNSEESRRLKDFGPFAGILSREERRKVFQKCVYDH